MKHIFYIQAVVFVLALSMAGCSKTDYGVIDDNLQLVEGITLGMEDAETSSQATTKASVNGVNYAVNTSYDPTRTKNNNSEMVLSGRDNWKLDFYLYNAKNVSTTKYEPASFEGGVYDNVSGLWKPNPDRQLFFPNYFKPKVEAWLYAETKDASIAKDQSTKEKILAQDQLFRAKNIIDIFKTFKVDLRHQHAMIDFKFEGVEGDDIDESSVQVRVGSEVYTPYSVTQSKNKTLEFLLILPEKGTSTGMTVEFNTIGNGIHQPITYKQAVTLNNHKVLGSNNCYCFTISGKAMEISPVTIINWTTGEPVLGEYVAVTAYPTFKGPKNSTYYFYYDNQLTDDGTLEGTPVLQEIAFNGEGECTIKPHGRAITHIFKGDKPSKEEWETYKLGSPIILGDKEKMYIDLVTIIANLP